MRKILLAAAAVTGLFAATTLTASAAPVTTVANVQVVPDNSHITNVDYYWNHHHWHHRHWEHDHWRYY